MSMHNPGTDDGPAVQFARSVNSWERNDWWRLEAHAWQGQSEVARALAFFAPQQAWKGLLQSANAGESAVSRVGGILRVISYIIAITAPTVFGFVMIGALLRPRGQISMLIVGGVMLIVILVESRSLIHSWRAHRPGEVRTGRMLGLLHVIRPQLASSAASCWRGRGGSTIPSRWWYSSSISRSA